MLALKAAKSRDSLVNFTVLLHDIGKTKTNPDLWPSHRGHDKLGAELIKKISRRIKAPAAYADFAQTKPTSKRSIIINNTIFFLYVLISSLPTVCNRTIQHMKAILQKLAL